MLPRCPICCVTATSLSVFKEIAITDLAQVP